MSLQLGICQPKASSSGLGRSSPMAVKEGNLLGCEVVLLCQKDGTDDVALLLLMALNTSPGYHVLQAAGCCACGDGRVVVVFLPSSLQLDLVNLERILATAVTAAHLLGGGNVLLPLVGQVILAVVHLFDAFG